MDVFEILDNVKRYAGKKKDFYDYLNDLQGIAALFGTYIMYVKDDDR